MVAPSMGNTSQMCIDVDSVPDTASLWVEFISESISRKGVILNADDGIRGTRSRAGERVRTGPYKISGSVSLYPDINNLDVFLLYTLGAGPATHLYSMTETLTGFYLTVDRGAKVFEYNVGYINKAVFSCSASDPKLKLTLDMEFETTTITNAGSFPAITGLDTNRPYIFSDVVVTIGGSPYSVFDWECTIDNFLEADRFVNELTRSQIPAKDREVSYKLTTAYRSTEAALLGVIPGSFGAITSVFTDSEETNSVLTFSSALLQYPTEDPTVTGKGNETKLTLNAIARTSGATKELTVNNSQT